MKDGLRRVFAGVTPVGLLRGSFLGAVVWAFLLGGGRVHGEGQDVSPGVLLSDSESRWTLGFEREKGFHHFGLDSESKGWESTGRAGTNLLSGPIRLEFSGADTNAGVWRPEKGESWSCGIPGEDGERRIVWTVSRVDDDFVCRVECVGSTPCRNIKIVMPFNPLQGAAVILPASLDKRGLGDGPWILVVPDFGHLRVESEPKHRWAAVNDGRRGWSPQNGPKSGVDPSLRGKAWLEAIGVPNYVPGILNLQFVLPGPLEPGESCSLRFSPVELARPEGIEGTVWKRVRRPYLNNWQPCGTWATPGETWVLANNVLSNPASSSLAFYAEPMVFYHEPIPGVDVGVLLRHSLDYWLDNHVSAQGHVNCFGHMYDLYTGTGAFLLVAAWEYWTISGDTAWLRKRIEVLHRMADYLQRRDVDGDGLIESYGSGNAGTLRDPDRADIWFEMMNFGHKNAWTNAFDYRAFLCMASLLDALGEKGGAEYYRKLAERLRESYVRRFLSAENGWFVSWISLDGQEHDYCHTFLNGAAVAYGLVDPEQGRQILERVVAKSKSIGFEQWQLGVPGNLIPCKKEDMIGPRIGLDGRPVNNDFLWPDNLSEEEAFGYRYPNGTIHPALTWYYILGLQVAGLNDEANRLLEGMLRSAELGLFQNGIVNVGYSGAEHFYFNGRTCGYEGFLPESFDFLMGFFTRDQANRDRLLQPMNHDR